VGLPSRLAGFGIEFHENVLVGDVHAIRGNGGCNLRGGRIAEVVLVVDEWVERLTPALGAVGSESNACGRASSAHVAFGNGDAVRSPITDADRIDDLAVGKREDSYRRGCRVRGVTRPDDSGDETTARLGG
jgi:hypothetical protein